MPGTTNGFMLEHGNEFRQAVACLDDGTRLVLDHARKRIGGTIDAVATSVRRPAAGTWIVRGSIEAALGTPAAGGAGGDRERANGHRECPAPQAHRT